MHEQLFKLYHNERDIERLSEELRGKQKELDRMVSGSSMNTYMYMYCIYMLKTAVQGSLLVWPHQMLFSPCIYSCMCMYMYMYV